MSAYPDAAVLVATAPGGIAAIICLVPPHLSLVKTSILYAARIARPLDSRVPARHPATSRSNCGLIGSKSASASTVPVGAFFRRVGTVSPASTTSGRSAALGADTPAYRAEGVRGRGIKAASRAVMSRADNITVLVPSW